MFIIFDERKLRPYSIRGTEINQDSLDSEIPNVNKLQLYNEDEHPKKNTHNYFPSKGCDDNIKVSKKYCIPIRLFTDESN